MPSVESVKKDLEALDTTGQEEILDYLEEVIVLGTYVTEVANEVKENRFSSGKIYPFCGHDETSFRKSFKGNHKKSKTFTMP